MTVAGSNPEFPEIPLAGNKRKQRKKDSREGASENPLELFAQVEQSENDVVSLNPAEVDAAGAELAASKATNCRWNMTTGDNLAEPDLWPHVEVRHTTHDAGGLIVRAKDKPGRLFVLVVGTLPRYRVVGWKRIDEARRDEYRWNDVWKVPQSGLTPL